MRIVIDLQSCQSNSRRSGIGRYSLELAKAMARDPREHDLWIALSALMPSVIPELRRTFADFVPDSRIQIYDLPSTIAQRTAKIPRVRAAEIVREDFLQTLQPDFTHLTSLFDGFEEDVATSAGQYFPGDKTAITLYDLIPLVQSARYLTDNEGRDYYASKIQNIKNAGLLLAISEYSRQEAIDLLGISADNVVNISSAADDRFQPISTDPETASRLLKRYSIRRKFLMYTSSFDPRKNQANLVSAFALLPHELRGNFQLVIVGDGSEEAVRKLRQLAEKSGLDHDEVIFPGHIVDADLVALYNLCHLFVLPSLAEGFGLPALEAMSCGTAAIASDLTSLPEVLGWSEALFDPTDPRSIAKKIHQVLTDEGFLNALRSNGLVQAKKFSWKQTANNAFDAFESHHQRSGKNQTKRSGQQAALTPLEPVASQAMMGAEEVVDRILKLDQASALTNEDLMEIAVSIAANRDRVEALFAQ